MLQDLRFGLKLLAKDRAFTMTALVTLALCIGANTAIFTVLNAVVLEPLPFSEPSRLLALYNIYPGVGVTDGGSNGVPDYLDRRQMTGVFESVTLFGQTGFDTGAAGSPVRLAALSVTPSFFHVLRVSPMIGRAFTEEDATFRKDQFAILSYGMWKDLYAGDPSAVGKEIRLNSVPYQIVGVMPEGFGLPGSDAKLWVPFAFAPQQTTDDARHNNNWSMIARLQPGATMTEAQKRIDVLNQRNIDRLPKIRTLLIEARFGTRVVGLKDELVKDVRPILYLLQAAVAFVLLIGCVNIANLMLVRSNIRMKELAIRFSLGAGRWRLARQLLTESISLALAGGALGIATAAAGVRLLAWFGARDLPRGTQIHIDPKVLAFSAATALLTGLVFGSIPLYHLLRRDLNAIFRSTERTGTTGRGALWTRSALVVCQVSLAFVLLIGAGLLTLSFARLLAVNPGFRPRNVVTAAVSLPRARYAEDARVRSTLANLVERVRDIPGVERAGIASNLPFAGNHSDNVLTIDGYLRSPGEGPPLPYQNIVDSGYLQAIGMTLLQGRFLADSDIEGSQRVAIIDQTMARRYWPKGNAIGATFHRGVDNSEPAWRIAGIVAPVKEGNLSETNNYGHVYYSYQQNPPRRVHLVVRTAAEDSQVTSAIRRELLRVDPELALFDVKPMEERLSASTRSRRAAMAICLVFASLALALSAIGIYGVLAYTVTQRTREFGIRLALGAGGTDVVRLVIGQGVKLAAIGLVIGVAAAFGLTRLMTTMLFDVKPTDPAVYAWVAGALMAVACAASLMPSLRAIRIHPSVALRCE